MKSYRKLLFLVALSMVMGACSTSPQAEPQFSISDFYIQESDYETRQHRVDGGQTVMSIKPKIKSAEDLENYRQQKMIETTYIMSITAEDAEKAPHYPTTVTFLKPVSWDEFRSVLAEYNIPHVNTIRYISTVGGGELPYEMIESGQIKEIEEQIAKGFEDAESFELLKSVSAMKCSVHKDRLVAFQNDPRVYLADIGPVELYEEGGVDKAAWDDLAHTVDKITGEEK